MEAVPMQVPGQVRPVRRRRRPPGPPRVRAAFHYNERNEVLDIYGVMVTWDKYKYSKKKLKKKFDGVIAQHRANQKKLKEQESEQQQPQRQQPAEQQPEGQQEVEQQPEQQLPEQRQPQEQQPEHQQPAEQQPQEQQCQRPEEQQPKPKGQPGKTVPRKKMPYFRRIGLTKAIIAFKTWREANEFADKPHLEFSAFIPLSFIVTVGVAIFEVPVGKVKLSEIYSISGGFEIMRARKKPWGNKTIVTICVRGNELPSQIYVGKNHADVTLHPRLPVHCTKCLRYGHRRSNCFRKARCGYCVIRKPLLRHVEKNCHMLRAQANFIRCMDCNAEHTTAQENVCDEIGVQKSYKNQLNEHRMFFVNTLETHIIPGIRNTMINSRRLWMD